MIPSRITPGSTPAVPIPEPSEPQSTRHNGGAHIAAQYDEPLEAGLTFGVSDPSTVPASLRLNVAMVFSNDKVYMSALDLGTSVEDETVQGAFGRLVETVREVLASSEDARIELLRYPPTTWFRLVPPDQVYYWIRESQEDETVAGQEILRGETEENALYDSEVPDLDALAEAQGVEPIGDIDELVADFWPEDESVEDIMATVRRWRDEGSSRHD